MFFNVKDALFYQSKKVFLNNALGILRIIYFRKKQNLWGQFLFARENKKHER